MFSFRFRSRDRRGGRGRWGERLASGWLRLRGYRILARNFATPCAEVDIVAQHGPDLVVVEVKTRRGEEVTVSRAQRQRLIHAARWIHDRYGRSGSGIRVDLVAVYLSRRWCWPRIRLESAVFGEAEITSGDDGQDWS